MISELKARKVEILDEDRLLVHSYTKNKYLTALLNSLSLEFPVGEKFFMAALRDHQHLVDSDLQAEIKGFIHQEASHGIFHRQINSLLVTPDQQIDIDAQSLIRLYSLGNTPEERLLTTCSLEVWTALGAILLKAIKDAALKDNSFCKAWKIHAKEEFEHRKTSHKVYNAVYKTSPYRKVKYFTLAGIHLLAQARCNYQTYSKNTND